MDIQKYIYGHCVHPKRVKIWDSYLQTYVVRELPCGHCLHCRNTRVNEWVTRLYAQQKVSKNTYFITLDYAPFDTSSPAALKLASETAAVSHSLNINHSLGLHPILLVRNHLDDFFKRLRKRGFIFQQFSCGEYGSKWSRPHFHIILFSNQDISCEDIQSAWTIDGYNIGRVDFHDLVANGSTRVNSKRDNKYSQKYVFKYVCKYLMKGNFDFESLKTLEYHKQYFNSLQYAYKNLDTLFPELYKIEDEKTLAENWLNYCATYSPFVSCSRRPAIGYSYLQAEIERFKTGDFRLFGLSTECKIFPRYFLRKTKESACSLVALGKDSLSPTTASRMPYIASVLEKIYSNQLDISHIMDDSAPIWCTDKKDPSVIRYSSFGGSDYIPKNTLSFYDTYERIYFIFNGYDYTLWQKSKKLYFNIGTMPLNCIIAYIHQQLDYYKYKFIDKFHDFRVYNESVLTEYINFNYHGDCSAFNDFVYKEYQKELRSLHEKNLKINNSHISF